MAVLPIGSHFAPPHKLTKRHAVATSSPISLSTRLPQNVSVSKLSGITGSRLSRHSVLVRAEDKIRVSSPSSSLEEPSQPLDESELEDLLDASGSCDPICSVDEPSSSYFEANYQPKTDIVKAIAILAAALTGTAAINHSWVAANQDLAMALLFGIGYAGIIFEESLAFNKSGVGLLMAVSLWVVRGIGAPSTEIAVAELQHATAEVSEIVFFILGAMTIVEIVDAHQGFKLVTDNITTRKPKTLLWVVGFVTFFLSSILDNLTSTIVMVSLLRKLVPQSEYRKLLGAVVVIAANAGGAWTPIGDVTTTMLWIHGQISTLPTIQKKKSSNSAISTNLEIDNLETIWDPQEIANYLDANIPNVELIASAIGVVSAIIDNVPLVAATMGMYDLTSFPQDSEFWQLVAFCAGTGGSMLIIGSAAGVAFMGMEKIDFFWYFRKVSGFAFAGYAAGIAAYLALQSVHFSIPTTVAQIPFLTGS
ncbi:hypothetical protein Bca52824_065941 [Brassica carinata]|uniref:Citrate transporter-like domain-containing protein n=1 Tax=Brassica carinata TaxID=52824 RepID=A0A8X7UCW2_BRACI|nr:hypothetical protein Bca52824_065941 [Brassica carinata]